MARRIYPTGAAHPMFKHGGAGTALYRVWGSMRDRCSLPSMSSYPQYGGRGIRVCLQWAKSFVAFRAWALAHGYRAGLSIDRIDNDGDYTPKNCRWATSKEQSRNTSRTVRLTAWGETKPLKAWIEDPRCRVDYSTLWFRVKTWPDSAEDMLTRETYTKREGGELLTLWGEAKSIGAWSHDPRCRVSGKNTLRARLAAGWSLEEALTAPPDRGRRRKT